MASEHDEPVWSWGGKLHALLPRLNQRKFVRKKARPGQLMGEAFACPGLYLGRPVAGV